MLGINTFLVIFATIKTIMNHVSGCNSPEICFRGVSFCIALYGEKCFKVKMRFWLQYLQRPLEKEWQHRHNASAVSTSYHTSMVRPGQHTVASVFFKPTTCGEVGGHVS